MKKTALILIALALAFTTACGGDNKGKDKGGSDSDRPTQNAISKSLASKNSVVGTPLPKKRADCVAKVFEESKLSDKTLEAIVKNDAEYKGTEKEAKILAGLGTKMNTECADAK